MIFTVKFLDTLYTAIYIFLIIFIMNKFLILSKAFSVLLEMTIDFFFFNYSNVEKIPSLILNAKLTFHSWNKIFLMLPDLVVKLL